MNEVWINGIRQFKLSVLESSAMLFGDGCFTTAAVCRGKVILLKAHVRRLQDNCRRLFINEPNIALLESEMRYAAIGHSKAVLKVIITSDIGKSGYQRKKNSSSRRIMMLLSWPSHYSKLQECGAILLTSPIRISRNSFFAGIKHLNRLEQIIIRHYIDKKEVDEALVLDTEEFIIECCTSNLFWRKGNDIYTPSLHQAGINGVMRSYIIEKMTSLGETCNVVVDCKREEIITADEVIICNSLMPILPVRKIDDICFSISSMYYKFHAFCCELGVP